MRRVLQHNNTNTATQKRNNTMKEWNTIESEKVNYDDDEFENFAGKIQLNPTKLTFGFSTLMIFLRKKTVHICVVIVVCCDSMHQRKKKAMRKRIYELSGQVVRERIGGVWKRRDFY